MKPRLSGNGKRYVKVTKWDTCDAVERHPDMVSGTWVFTETRLPISALFDNLGDGASIDQFLEWFPGVSRWKVEAVLSHGMAELAASSRL